MSPPASPAAGPGRAVDSAQPTSEDGKHLARLARRGTASVVGAAFGAVSGLLLVVIVTNGFSAALAGTLFAATSAFLILEAVALLGTDTGLVKWLPDQLASGRAADLGRTLVVATLPVLAVSVGVGLLVSVTAPSLAPLLVGAGEADAMTTMLRTLAVVLPVAALHDVVMTATRGTGSMRPTVVVEHIGRLSLQALLVLGVYLAGGGVLALAVAWSAPYALGLAAGGWWLHRLLVRAARRADAGCAARPWSVIIREFWGYTAPRAVARVTQTALKRSDIVMVAALASPADAALYAAATRFIVLGQLFVQSVQQALAPHLSALFANDEHRSAQVLFWASTRWSVLACWPFYLLLAAFAPLLLQVFGDGYSSAAEVVVVLSLTMLVATACGPVDSVLLMAGRSWLSLRNSTVALAVNVGLNLLLVPAFGIVGAAASWSVAIVVRNLLPLTQVHRQLGMSPLNRPTTQVAAAAVVCFGTVALVALVAGSSSLVALGAVLPASGAYLLGVWRWRDRLGLGAFRTAVRRRRGTARLPELGEEVRFRSA